MKEDRLKFEQTKKIHESALLTFKGVDGFDVYNCSVPFLLGGKKHIYGRVEKRHEWVASCVRLFVETAKDEFTLVPGAMSFYLEDPYVSFINGETIFGGTQIRKNRGDITIYYCDFYRGPQNHLRYFTSGPDRMKDIRLVQLKDGKVGIFSHHKTANSCMIGWAVVNSMDELSSEAIDSAEPLDQFDGVWGGVNQAYLLSSGKIGCIAHHGYLDKDEKGDTLSVYCITSFVFDPETKKVHDFKLIGTRNCFPDCEAKVPRLVDCAFVSGVFMREDGKCDLYSGICDTHEGRITIDYPFEGHGTMQNVSL